MLTPVFVTATLLIYAWAGQNESQRHGELKLTASLHATEESAAHTQTERQV